MTTEMATLPGRMPRERRVKSVAKAVQILHAFSPGMPLLSVRELARRTGLPRATVHALCQTLNETGMLSTGAHGGYRIGPTVSYLAEHSVVGGEALAAAAEAVLAPYVRRHGAGATVTRLVDGWSHHLEGPRRFVSIQAPGSSRAPAYLDPAGRAALASLDPEEALERALRAAAADREVPPDRGALLKDLAAIAAHGHLVENDDGLTVVAVSIADPRTGATAGGAALRLPAGDWGDTVEWLATVGARKISRCAYRVAA